MNKRRTRCKFPGDRHNLTFEALECRRLLVADIDVEVLINDQVAGIAPGPAVEVGSELVWQYTVANPGDEPLSQVSLSDDRGTADAADDIVPVPRLADVPLLGTLEATFENLRIAKFVLHPSLPLLYASVSDANSVVVIDTEALQIVDTIATGVSPGNMALTPDGSRLYVANNGSPFLTVIDTATQTSLAEIPLPEPIQDVEVTGDEQLYTLSTRYLRELDLATGISGPNILAPNLLNGLAEIAVSPTKDRLYFAIYTRNFSRLYQYDLTIDPPFLIYADDSVTSGSDGKDLEVSHDGSRIVYSREEGNGVSFFRAADMAIVGNHHHSASAREATFSPDDSLAYSVRVSGAIEVGDTESYLTTGTIATGVAAFAEELIVDASGAHLFAAIGNQLRVFATGRGPRFNIGDTNRDEALDPGESWQFGALSVAATGLNSATATVIAESQSIGSISDTAEAWYEGRFGIQLTTHVNGLPNDSVAAGSEVQLEWMISNSGTTPIGDVELASQTSTSGATVELTPVLVTGDLNGNNLLDPDETWVFAADIVSLPGATEVVATVSGIPHDANGPLDDLTVSAASQADCFGELTAIKVEVATNGIDADDPAGPRIEVGSVVTWTYDVTNTGTVPLTNVNLSDDLGIALPTDALVPTPTVSPEFFGQLAKTFEGVGVSKFVLHPTEPLLYASVPSRNSVLVFNTDTMELVDSIHAGSVPVNLALSPDASRLYVRNNYTSMISVIDTETHSNIGTLTVPLDVEDMAISDHETLYLVGRNWLREFDPSAGELGPVIADDHVVREGSLEINAARDRLYYITSGIDSSPLTVFDLTTNPPTPFLQQLKADNRYIAHDFALSFDDQTITVARQSSVVPLQVVRTSDLEVLGTLDTSGYSEFTFGPYGNAAYGVSANLIYDDEIRVFDTASYDRTGIIIAPGSVLEITTDQRGEYLYAMVSVNFVPQINVYHTGQLAPSTIPGDLNHNGLLDPGETWTYTASGTAEPGFYRNIATVTATTLDGVPVAASDSSHYVAGAAIAIDTSVNGIDTSASNRPTLDLRNDAHWTYEVTNSGTIPLANVSVIDGHDSATSTDDDFAAEYVSGDVNQNQWLDPEEIWTFQAWHVPAYGSQYTEARVTANLVDPLTGPLLHELIEAGDGSYFFGAEPLLEIQLRTNGIDADEPVGPLLDIGSEVTWTYEVTNRGNISVDAVEVLDTRGTPETNDDFAPDPIHNPQGLFGLIMVSYNGPSSSSTAVAMLRHPTLPLIYATLSDNYFQVINTETRTVEHTAPVGNSPQGMAISPDGAKVYVARGGASVLSVFQATTFEPLADIPLPAAATDVEVGSDGQLLVLTANGILQIDPVTGAEVAPPINAIGLIANGELAISPAKDRLYYASFGVQPAYLYQFDLTVSPPALANLRQEPSVGRDLELSNNGEFLSFATAAGQGSSQLAKIRTSDFSIEGYFATQGVASDIAFSPDDTVAYTLSNTRVIEFWNTATFEFMATISAVGTPQGLFVPQDGLSVLTAETRRIRSYNNGFDGIQIMQGDLNRNQRLDPNETWSYRWAETVVPEQYATSAHVSALPSSAVGVPYPGFAEVEANDPSHYFGIASSGATVVKRQLFYNNSVFDGHDPAANSNDDAALATTKQALLPNRASAPENISAFEKGINGVMLDFARLPAGIELDAASDFEFGRSVDPAMGNWQPAPVPSSITIRRGAGAGGSDRITLIWPDMAIANTWLRIVVRPTTNTGLAAADEFYFGHMLADVSGDGKVNAFDYLAIRQNPKTFLDPASANDPYDINRDGRVNAIDLTFVRDSASSLGNSLKMVSIPPKSDTNPTGSKSKVWIIESERLTDPDNQVQPKIADATATDACDRINAEAIRAVLNLLNDDDPYLPSTIHPTPENEQIDKWVEFEESDLSEFEMFPLA